MKNQVFRAGNFNRADQGRSFTIAAIACWRKSAGLTIAPTRA
jgi:hypothetical protein